MTDTKRPWLAAVGAFLMLFAVGLTSGGLSVFYLPVTADLGFSQTSFSLYVSIIALTGIVSFPLSGRLTSKYNRHIRWFVRAGAVGCLLCFFLYSRARSLTLFYAASVLMGFFVSTYANVIATSIVNNWFYSRRALIVSVIYTGTSLGSIFFVQLGSSIILNLGWRAAYVILGGIDCLILLAASCLISPKPELLGLYPYGWDSSAQTQSAAPQTGLTMPQALKTLCFWVLSIGIFIGCIYVMGIQQSIVPSLQVDFGYTPIAAAAIFSVYNISCCIGKILMGVVMDRWGFVVALVYMLVLLTAAMILMLNASVTAVAVAFAVCFGLGNMFASVIASNATSGIFGVRDYSSIFGMVTIFYVVGMAVGPIAAGSIVDMTGSYHKSWYVYGALILISGAIVLAAYLSRNKLRKKYSDQF